MRKGNYSNGLILAVCYKIKLKANIASKLKGKEAPIKEGIDLISTTKNSTLVSVY
jgi:hypothetical protein